MLKDHDSSATKLPRGVRPMLAAAATAALAACGEGGIVDDTVRSGLRQSAVEACLAWAPESTIAQAAGLSRERLCACAADRILEGGTLSDLRPDSPEARDAILQCASEIRSGSEAPKSDGDTGDAEAGE